MFHSSQLEFRTDLHHLCPSAESDPRVRGNFSPETPDLQTSDNTSDVLYLDSERRAQEERVSALHSLNTVTVDFDTTLQGQVDKKHFEIGCEAGEGAAPVDYTVQEHEEEDGVVHRIAMHWDNNSPEKMIKVGQARILKRSEQYPKHKDEIRLERITAHLLMQEGIGHIERFPTGSRHQYDSYVAQLREQGVDYIKFSDGFYPCVMTARLDDEHDQAVSLPVVHDIDDSNNTYNLDKRAA